jgi:hypothetical protein
MEKLAPLPIMLVDTLDRKTKIEVPLAFVSNGVPVLPQISHFVYAQGYLCVVDYIGWNMHNGQIVVMAHEIAGARLDPVWLEKMRERE